MNAYKPSSAPTAKEAQRVVKAAATAAHEGRDLAAMAWVNADEATPLGELLGELARISDAARHVKPEKRGEVFEILRVTAREIERYVA